MITENENMSGGGQTQNNDRPGRQENQSENPERGSSQESQQNSQGNDQDGEFDAANERETGEADDDLTGTNTRENTGSTAQE